MDIKKILLFIIILILLCSIGFSVVHNNNQQTINNTTNETNITLNESNATDNNTIQDNQTSKTSQKSSSGSSNQYLDEDSDEYVEKWDESNRRGDDWAYLHKQPTKTDSEGHKYKRIYDEKSQSAYWYQMDSEY